MISPQTEDKSQHLESRVLSLEIQLAQMRQMLSGFPEKKSRWWLKVAGSFENDSNFDEVVQLGKEWRESFE